MDNQFKLYPCKLLNNLIRGTKHGMEGRDRQEGQAFFRRCMCVLSSLSALLWSTRAKRGWPPRSYKSIKFHFHFFQNSLNHTFSIYIVNADIKITHNFFFFFMT